MGILFHQFCGTLEDIEKLKPELVTRSKRANTLSYLRIDVNAKVTERLMTYVDEFRSRGYDRVYGGINLRPLHGEGGGCSIFAASCLELIGLLHDEFTQAWSRNLKFPSHLIGGPKAGRKVSLLTLLGASRWAEEHEPHEKGTIWDPDLMHEWLERKYEAIKAENPEEGLHFTPETWNFAHGLRHDARTAEPPPGKIFRHLE